MSILLAIGTSVGFALGAAHGWGVYGQRMKESEATAGGTGLADRLRAVYSGLWTVALWTLFGSYVLILWLVSVPLWIGSRVTRSGDPVVAEA